jgi:hypothetical protein
MLTDDEFADSGHPNIFGMEKFQSAFLDIALPFLRSTRAKLFSVFFLPSIPRAHHTACHLNKMT